MTISASDSWATTKEAESVWNMLMGVVREHDGVEIVVEKGFEVGIEGYPLISDLVRLLSAALEQRRIFVAYGDDARVGIAEELVYHSHSATGAENAYSDLVHFLCPPQLTG